MAQRPTADLIDYEHYTLANGLTVVLHHDPKRTVVAVNVLYRVGSRNDPPHRTGLAHLFEHLMFAGSRNAPNFDDALQLAGGDNNAVTSSDYTLYYDTLPAANLETALWLEADRMRELNFSQKSLRTQQKVVVEEFKETCLEQPYGDLFHHLNDLLYTVDGYRWPVIGENFDHIQQATLAEIKDFYYRYYRPDNAILTIAGSYDPTTIGGLVEQYFGDIPPSDRPRPAVPAEPEQTDLRRRTVTSEEVPSPVIYLHYRTVDRLHPDYPVTDVLAFLLGAGQSSFLYRKLVRDADLFTEVSASINDNLEAGGILIEAHPAEDVDYATAQAALLRALEEARTVGFTQRELDKVVNSLELRNHYRDISIESRAGELAFFTMLGDTGLVNTELDGYLGLTLEQVNAGAGRYLTEGRRSELEYLVG